MRAKPAMIDNIRLRMAHDEKRRLAELATRRGLTISELIRRQIGVLMARALDNITAQALAEITGEGVQPGSEVWDAMSKLGDHALTPGKVPSLESLFGYIAIAHSLHAASASVRASGNTNLADELHGIGQLFLCYATGDIERFYSLAGLVFTKEEGERYRKIAEFHRSPNSDKPETESRH